MQTSKARREAATLFCVLFLLGVLLGSFATHLWAGRVSGAAIQTQTRKNPPTRDEIVSNFNRELQLTPEQQQQLGIIIDSTQSRVRALYAPVDAQRDSIRKECHERIRAILTPDQVPKFDDFLRRLEEQHKKDAAH
jgi:Spy/CpxP family protein refolding chaperone